jgi:hypothetical protein
VVWNQSLLWGQGTARSTLAERLQQAAALLRQGGVAYLGEMEAALMSVNLQELRQAAESAGLVMDGKLTVLERADKGGSAVVLRFVKQ